jgi:hypothetical protein
LWIKEEKNDTKERNLESSGGGKAEKQRDRE